MREWVPVPGSAKARLIEAAIHQFELDGYEAVNVVDLAGKASVTTGALYHHFGSKLGLYLTVREDMEKRIVERMEGAAGRRGTEGTPRCAPRSWWPSTPPSGSPCAGSLASSHRWSATTRSPPHCDRC